MRKEEIAELLLDQEAVALSPSKPYTFASGIKSPIYCDNRVMISAALERQRVVDAFVEVLCDQKVDFDVVAGTATAGIAWAAWIAEHLKKPMVYVRGAAKSHGQKNQIEGRLQDSQTVLLIEDLISTGGSSLAAVQALQSSRASVVACVAIFTYGFSGAHQNFEEQNIPLYTLSDFPTLLSVAAKRGDLSPSEQSMVSEWNQDPKAWAEKYFQGGS